jgi:hypothetical protein
MIPNRYRYPNRNASGSQARLRKRLSRLKWFDWKMSLALGSISISISIWYRSLSVEKPRLRHGVVLDWHQGGGSFMAVRMEKTLLVLAAGMGSRYGGLKQVDGFGPGGETLLEYSLYDARRAGFSHVVFVIRREMEALFREKVLARLPVELRVSLCFQELDCLPSGCRAPVDRQKPWGTAHAVWVARQHLEGPFALVNGDDFYGRAGFEAIASYFDGANWQRGQFCMVAYALGRTLSAHGTVSRGICRVDASGNLGSLEEVGGIHLADDGVVKGLRSGEVLLLGAEDPVSMNLFGLDGSLLPALERDLCAFLSEAGNLARAECYLPAVVNGMVAARQATVRVLRSADAWFGVTHPDDRALVRDGIRVLVDAGHYPERLWE